jgi:hypothetical protein
MTDKPDIKAAKEELLSLTGRKPSPSEVAGKDIFDEHISDYFSRAADMPPAIYLTTLTMNIGMLAEGRSNVTQANVKAVLDKYAP